jgi:hypothetical protein
MARTETRGADTPEKLETAKIVADAVEAFLGAGVPAIERACNERRLLILEYLRSRPAGATLPEWGLRNVTVETAIEEASPEFQLTECPVPLLVQLADVRYPENPEVPMACGRDKAGCHIFVFFPVCREWLQRAPLLLKLTTWHEMLHACGDCENDGIVRHNKIGVDSVVQLLTGKSLTIDGPPCL